MKKEEFDMTKHYHASNVQFIEHVRHLPDPDDDKTTLCGRKKSNNVISEENANCPDCRRINLKLISFSKQSIK